MYTLNKIQDCHGKSSIQQEEDFPYANWIEAWGRKWKSASTALHFEHCFVWYWNLALRKAEQNALESFELWWWRNIKNIIWTECVKNEVLQRV